MVDFDDIDALAGEYVLGTLDAAERTAVAARRQREPALEAAITAWERRLGPLMEEIAPVQPPDHLRDLVMRRIGGTAGSSEIAMLQRRLRTWRIAALGAAAVAAGLVLFVATGTFAPRPGQNFVAVLQHDAASPAFIVSVNIAARTLTIRPVAATPQTNRSYELWLVNSRIGAPRSLGVVQNAAFTVASSQLNSLPPGVVRDSTFAVTLEPLGGSPSGLPTGPILYSGTLVQATP